MENRWSSGKNFYKNNNSSYNQDKNQNPNRNKSKYYKDKQKGGGFDFRNQKNNDRDEKGKNGFSYYKKKRYDKQKSEKAEHCVKNLNNADIEKTLLNSELDWYSYKIEVNRHNRLDNKH